MRAITADQEQSAEHGRCVIDSRRSIADSSAFSNALSPSSNKWTGGGSLHRRLAVPAAPDHFFFCGSTVEVAGTSLQRCCLTDSTRPKSALNDVTILASAMLLSAIRLR
jgi:hypothetical protein